MGANDELRGLVPEGVPEALAALGFAVEEVRDEAGDGSIMAFLVDEQSLLAHSEVLMITWDGGASFSYLDAEGDVEDTLALGYTEADVEHFEEEMLGKVDQLRCEVGRRYFGAAW